MGEAEIKRIAVQASSEKKMYEIPSQQKPIMKARNIK
jgi:hypothetical protein